MDDSDSNKFESVLSIIEQGVRLLLYLLAAVLGFYLLLYEVLGLELNRILILVAGSILLIRGLEGALKVGE